MKINFKSIFTGIFAFFLVIHSSNAEIKNYKIETSKNSIDEFSLDLPKGWIDSVATKDNPGMYGAPLILFGPENEEKKRTVMFVTPTGIKDPKELVKTMDKDPTDYRAGLMDFLDENEGEIISWDEQVIKKDWNNFSEASFLGAKYELNDDEFYERSAILFGKNNKIYHVKSISLEKYADDHQSAIDRTIASIKINQ